MENLEKLVKRLIIGLIVLCTFMIIGFGFLTYRIHDLKNEKEKHSIEKMDKIDSLIFQFDTILIKFDQVVVNVLPYGNFFDALGKSESGNNYAQANPYGYIGKYQFGYKTLVGVGVCQNIGEAKEFRDKFISSPDSVRINMWSPVEQEMAMVKLTKYHKKHLNKYIKEYRGKIINGIYITESGILAAAHLSGAKGVEDYFNNNENFADANGVTIEHYLKKFCGFKI